MNGRFVKTGKFTRIFFFVRVRRILFSKFKPNKQNCNQLSQALTLDLNFIYSRFTFLLQKKMKVCAPTPTTAYQPTHSLSHPTHYSLSQPITVSHISLKSVTIHQQSATSPQTVTRQQSATYSPQPVSSHPSSLAYHSHDL